MIAIESVLPHTAGLPQKSVDTLQHLFTFIELQCLCLRDIITEG